MNEPNPYASPVHSSKDSPADEFERFYMSFWPPFVMFGLITLPIFFRITWDLNLQFDDWLFVLTIFCAWLFAEGLFVLVINRFFPVLVGKRGLKCYDFWARYGYVEWPSIHSVKPTNFLGLKYLLVYSSQFPRPLWVPVYLTQRQAFRETALSRGFESDAFHNAVRETKWLQKVDS